MNTKEQQDKNSTAQNAQDILNLTSPDLTSKISIYKGDITKLSLDAIVNSTNTRLVGRGSGVDEAIYRAAGIKLLDECRNLNGCKQGNCKITSGYNIPSKYIIHTVGPKTSNPQILQNCYEKSLNLMTDCNLRTIGFPCIGTGARGFPSDNGALIATKTVRKFVETNFGRIDRIILVLFLEKDVKVYEKPCNKFSP